MELEEIQKNIRTKSELASFVLALKADLNTNRDEWQNVSLEDFLESLSAWIEVMDNCYRNNNQPVIEVPEWKTFARMLLAAKYYE